MQLGQLLKFRSILDSTAEVFGGVFMPLGRVSLRALPLDEHPAHGGAGLVRVARVARRGDLAGRCNFIDYAVVPPGGSIGDHRHAAGEEELYLVLAGSAVMRLDGEEVRVGPGDLVRNRPGGVHSLRNDGPGDVELFVFELEVEPCEPRR